MYQPIYRTNEIKVTLTDKPLPLKLSDLQKLQTICTVRDYRKKGYPLGKNKRGLKKFIKRKLREKQD